jgi:hypothetical protein
LNYFFETSSDDLVVIVLKSRESRIGKKGKCDGLSKINIKRCRLCKTITFLQGDGFSQMRDELSFADFANEKRIGLC